MKEFICCPPSILPDIVNIVMTTSSNDKQHIKKRQIDNIYDSISIDKLCLLEIFS